MVLPDIGAPITDAQVHAFADTYDAIAHLNGVAHASELMTDIRDAFSLAVTDAEIDDLRTGWLAVNAA